MRRVAAAALLLSTLLLSGPAFADEAILVLTLTVEVGGTLEAVPGAKVGREWLLSWEENPTMRRSVVLQPVSRDGIAGAARTLENCTLDHFSGLKGQGSNVAESLRLSCRP